MYRHGQRGGWNRKKRGTASASPHSVTLSGTGQAGKFRVGIRRGSVLRPGAMDILGAHAARHPDRAALIEGERVWSWAGLIERRNRLGHSLAELGLEPGEHAIVYAGNSLEHYLAGTGARAAGLIPAPMNHRLVAEEVAYILDHSDAVAVFVSEQFLAVCEEVRAHARRVRHWILMGNARRDWALHLDDLLERGRPEPVEVSEGAGYASIIYTGGTTGKPKGALRRGL